LKTDPYIQNLADCSTSTHASKDLRSKRSVLPTIAEAADKSGSAASFGALNPKGEIEIWIMAQASSFQLP